MRSTAVPATRLVASPPFKSRRSIRRMSARKARGVNTARRIEERLADVCDGLWIRLGLSGGLGLSGFSAARGFLHLWLSVHHKRGKNRAKSHNPEQRPSLGENFTGGDPGGSCGNSRGTLDHRVVTKAKPCPARFMAMAAKSGDRPECMAIGRMMAPIKATDGDGHKNRRTETW